jgi:hypothetical protein
MAYNIFTSLYSEKPDPVRFKRFCFRPRAFDLAEIDYNRSYPPVIKSECLIVMVLIAARLAGLAKPNADVRENLMSASEF